MARTEKRLGIVLAIAGSALLSAWPSAAQESHWPRFRGPNGLGVREDRSIPASFAAADFRWNVRLPGPGHSSPVVWGDKVFVTCELPETQERLVAGYAADDGRLLFSWREAYEPYRTHQKLNSYAASTPAVDAERVYVAWVSGRTFIVLALDHQGRLAWRRSMPDFEARFGAGASPTVVGDMVVVANDHAGQHSFLIALDARTGQTRWKTPRRSGLASYITPCLYQPPDGAPQLIVVSPAHGVTGVNPASGEVLWEVGDLFHFRVVASPIVAGGLIFASSGKGSGGRESAVIRPATPESGEPAELVYRIRTNLPYVPTPIAYGGRVFLWTDGGVVTCLEPATGGVVWRERVGGEYFASPVCVGGRLFGVSKTGEVVVLDAAPAYRVIGRSQLPEGSFATPAVAGGAMYLRTFTRLMRLDGRSRSANRRSP